jgi:acylphosphatase
MIAYRIRVSGRVQGVFYRASTKTKADELGLSGWVQNEPDGSVLMEIQGEKEAIDKMIEWCHSGPPHAVVDNVEKEEISLREFVRFEIRRA